MPALEQSWQTHKDKVAFVGVALWDTESDARKLAEKMGVAYPLGLDKSDKIAKEYAVTGLPTTLFIDADGVIARRITGSMTAGGMTFFINAVLQ